MITTPKIYCPLCGQLSTVVETLRKARYGSEAKYLCVCGCGESEMTVKDGKIQSFELREAEKHPDFRILAG